MAPAASAEDIEKWEERWHIKMPVDIKRMYMSFDGFCLFKRDDPRYKLIALKSLMPTRDKMYLGQSDCGVENMLALFELYDGNFVALHIDTLYEYGYALIDAFHETFWREWKHPRVISRSLFEFLSEAIAAPNEYFWLCR